MTLWYDELDLAWRKAPMALAGVTLVETLFVLETFALDRNMHVVYRGEHGLVENGKIAHRLAGPAPLIERLSPLPKPWETGIGGRARPNVRSARRRSRAPSSSATAPRCRCATCRSCRGSSRRALRSRPKS